ncbi:hypothetical protein SmJEL517_g04101 [Synchytrium microbalum]|uniref:EIPR1-like beta-propeller domain-containing protein n=1 Tax=Synchytrium microbalum TaxID=1806994 RepID=A0A507BZQ6_9FUNG|nr:uncharacterized protein SmJEL517_g04101 [Synchytrium microbalum]TPX32922.1 hypothetical protein SmJEL517_g04101 [Synchytrium microbalum]
MVATSTADSRNYDIPSELWRRTTKVKSAIRCHTALNDAAKWSTRIQAASPYVVVSSGAKSKNLYVIEHQARSKFDPDDSNDQEPSLNVRSVFTIPHPIYGMCIHQNKLVLGGPDGVAQLFEINSSELASKGKGLTHLSELSIGETTTLEAVPVSAPGQWTRSIQLRSIQLCPTDPNRLLATQGRSVKVLQIASGATESFDIGSDLLNVASFSPHNGSVFSAAGADRNIYTIDVRLEKPKNAVWTVQKAHSRAVTDLQFSPFIPYWLASSSDDGVVKVWDLRYGKQPAARVDGHYQGVNAVAWSNTRVDLLATVSSDKSWRAWTFNSSLVVPRHPGNDIVIACPGSEWSGITNKQAGDVSVGATQVGECYMGYAAPVLAVTASSLHPDTFYCVSAVGDVQSHCLPAEIFEESGGYVFGSRKFPAEAEFERALRARNLSSALSQAATLTKSNPKPEPVLNLCRPKPAITEAEYVIDGSKEGGPQVVQEFRKGLDEWCIGLPPAFDLQPWLSLLPSTVKQEFDGVTFRLNLSNDIATGNWQNIVKYEKSLLQSMSSDPQYLDIEILKSIVDCIFPHEPVRAMHICLKSAEIAEDVSPTKFSEFSELLWVCLFPSVYDSEKFLPPLEVLDWSSLTSSKWMLTKDARKSRRRDIEGTLRDSRVVLSMVRVEINLQKILNRPNLEDEVLRVIAGDRAMESGGTQAAVKERERTLSARANRMYLDALLKSARYEDWFGVCVELISTFQTTDFARQLMTIADKVAMRHIRSHVDSLFKEASTHLSAAVQLAQQNAGPLEISNKLTSSIQILGKTFVLVSRIASAVVSLLPSAYNYEKEANREKEASDKEVTTMVNNLSVQLKDLLNMLGTSLPKILGTAKKMLGPVGSSTYTSLWAAVNVLLKDMEVIGRSFRRGDKGPTGQLLMEIAENIQQLKTWVLETGGTPL